MLSFLKKYGIFLVLALLFVVFSLSSDTFLSAQNLMNVLRQVSMMGIVAVGISFVLIAGGIDLSVGSQISLVNIMGAWLMVNAGMHPAAAVAMLLIAAAIVGLLNGWLTIRMNIHPLMVTLATMTILAGLSKMISGGLSIYGFPASFAVIGQGYVGAVPVPVLIFVAVSLIGSFILNRTVFGRYVYAIGGNEEAARLSGVATNRIKLAIFSICGFFTGIAGVVMLSRMNSGQPNAGAGFEFDVLTAVVLGGVSIMGGEGKISGVITGVLIIGILSNGLILMNVGDYYQSVIKGVVLLAAIGLDGLQRRSKKKRAQAARTVAAA